MHQMEKLEKIKNIINEIRKSKDSDFYQKIWRKKSDFLSLPVINAKHFIETPLSLRSYKKERGLTKVVKKYRIPFLVQWGLNDLKVENFGSKCKRPLVLFSDSHEALEKSLWFYENNILPLIGENNNLPVAVFAAKRYEIDYILSDEKILRSFLPLFEKEYNLKEIQTLTLIGSQFNINTVKLLIEKFKLIRLILGLSEVGAFAEVCQKELLKGKLIFHTDKNSLIEIEDRNIIVTKLSQLITPIIRYQTNILADFVNKQQCDCKEEGIVLL